MRKFNFRLERFLDIRKYKEREWELKLAEITGVCISLKNNIEERLRTIVVSMKKRAMHSDSIDIELFLAYEKYINRLEVEISAFQEELVLKELQRSKVQKSYLEASSKRKVLEKLKEKRGIEFYKEQRKDELKETDDLTNSRFNREVV